MLTALATLRLAMACAPAVAPETMLALTRAESGLDPLAIGVNAHPHQTLHPYTKAAAIVAARALMARGLDLDVGLAQLNVRTLTRLRMPIAAAFEPCDALAAASAVLAVNYRLAWRTQSDPQRALRTALSLYNTGHPTRGWRNGYVRRVEAAAGAVPALTQDKLSLARTEGRPAFPPVSTVDVFADDSHALLIWAPKSAEPRPNPLVFPSKSGGYP